MMLGGSDMTRADCFQMIMKWGDEKNDNLKKQNTVTTVKKIHILKNLHVKI